MNYLRQKRPKLIEKKSPTNEKIYEYYDYLDDLDNFVYYLLNTYWSSNHFYQFNVYRVYDYLTNEGLVIDDEYSINENKEKLYKEKKIIFPFKDNLKGTDFIKNLFKENFSNVSFENNKIIGLRDNKIKNIKFLTEVKLPNLGELNLAKNELGDDNIKYFPLMSFKNLNNLNVFGNNFTDPLLFKVISVNFKESTNLSIGLNPFKEYEDNNSDDKKEIYYFNKVEILGMGTWACKGTYKELTISRFRLPNIKTLYLNRNGITSLEFLKNLGMNYLEDLEINNNLISDISPLENFSLKELHINENKITDLSDFILKLPLELLDLKYNPINTFDPITSEKNMNIINKLKEKAKYKELLYDFDENRL